MATIDPTSNAVVIRIVYDGPPFAGKTTSVRTLAQGLGGQVVVPEEIDGRTVFFDWLDYTGGTFDGHRICCQIISVPGQAVLAARRRHLISTADVVVFVGDSTREAHETVGRYLESLQDILSSAVGPSVGIVLQANKRDHMDATPMPEIQQMLDDRGLRVAIVESVATEGIGIRETFVFAVRLALDRVRELIGLDLLPIVPPEVNSAADLLEDLRQMEGGTFLPLPASGLVEKRLSEGSVHTDESIDAALRRTIQQSGAIEQATLPLRSRFADEPPLLPHGELPSGMIWPPVEGRMMLHEILRTPPQITRTSRGHWVATSAGHWLVHSPSCGRFATLELGRAALLDWARIHASSRSVISSHRCIALADDGDGHYRLWQFVRKEFSQLEQLRGALTSGPRAIADYLVGLASLHDQAARLWPDAGCRLPLGLGTMIATATGPRHIGILPYPIPSTSRIASDPASAIDWMAKELAFAHTSLSEQADEIDAAIEAIVGTDRSRVEAHTSDLRELMARFKQTARKVDDVEKAN